MANKNMLNEMMQVNPQAPSILDKWSREIGAINEAFDGNLDYMKQMNTALLLESTSNYLNRHDMARRMNGSMNEATQPTDVGYFKKYAINLLAAAIPNLIAPDIVSMQPMLSRVGEMRYLKILYGSNKGNIKAGDTMFSMFHGGNGETAYSSDEVDAEYVTPDGNNKIEVNLAWLPVVPGSVKLTVGLNEYVDDGAGHITGTGITGTGTVDYNTGAVSITLANAPAEGDDVYFNYHYNNMDVPVQAPEVNLKIEVAPIIAKSRKLKTLYSFDAAFDMTKDYGMQINNELVTYTAAQIKHEIDGEIMGDLLRIASAAAVTWDATPREGISLRDHNESFYNKIVEAGNNIFDATKLANGSFLIVGINASNIVETLPRFRASGVVKPVGPHLVGYLGSMPVYKNPFYPADTFLVGWKGDGLFDAGYLYCPYMPIMTTQLIMDANFEGQRGFATSYGKKPVNSKMYCKGTITHS